MVLAISDITVELREILLKNRPKELIEISSKGTVPVLYLNNDVIDESYDIMLWSINQDPNNSLLTKMKNKQLEIIKRNDNNFKYWLDRYKYYDRYPNNDQAYYQGMCNPFLEDYNNLLKQNKYLLSGELGLVDISIFPFIRQFSNVDSEYLDNHFTDLSNWLNKIIKSKLFSSVMKKYNVWDNTHKPLIINFND